MDDGLRVRDTPFDTTRNRLAMGAFGKILLVVNLLAAGGFAYLAIQDYKGRQTIQAAGLRHLILLGGVPVEGGPDVLPARVAASADNYDDFAATEIPFHIEGPGGALTDSVSPELLYVYFAGAGDAGTDPLAGTIPVASQLAELKRVFGIIKANLDKQDGPAAKAQFAGSLLLYQAETIEERIEILALMARGNGNELAHLLDIKFHRVAPKIVDAGHLNPDLWSTLDSRIADLDARRAKLEEEATAATTAGNTAEAERKKAEAGTLVGEKARKTKGPPKDEPERRARLAHLLVHLDPNAAWQKRTMMVIGIRAYVGVIGTQAVRFQEMANRVERMTADDQSRFVDQYTATRKLAIQRTQVVEETKEVAARWAAQVVKDQDVVTQRQTQLDDLKALLARVRIEVNALLAQQTLTEQQLFAVEREIGLTLEDIYAKEAQLRQLERERYEQKK